MANLGIVGKFLWDTAGANTDISVPLYKVTPKDKDNLIEMTGFDPTNGASNPSTSYFPGVNDLSFDFEGWLDALTIVIYQAKRSRSLVGIKWYPLYASQSGGSRWLWTANVYVRDCTSPFEPTKLNTISGSLQASGTATFVTNGT